ncbi:unnamed protein product [Protopolystoma xenopodis]|uniref:Uncharacterized protein n=1 Tax=Protopolystoma xenopodis TaxID=117903 RepID=A0A448WZ14_9PLAT|nr:unnamed protein product [Protopolystoma xenopodis]
MHMLRVCAAGSRLSGHPCLGTRVAQVSLWRMKHSGGHGGYTARPSGAKQGNSPTEDGNQDGQGHVTKQVADAIAFQLLPSACVYV